MKKKTTHSKVKIQDLTHDTVPATVGLVKEVRDELRADIRSVDYKIDSLQNEIRAVEHKLGSKIEQVNSKVELVMVSVHRTQVLMEEQRGENRIVLDGIKNLIERQDRIESDVNELQNTVKILSVGTMR